MEGLVLVYSCSEYCTINSSRSALEEKTLPSEFLISDREASDFAQFAILIKYGVTFSLFKSSKLQNFSNSFLSSRSIIVLSFSSDERISSASKEMLSLQVFRRASSEFYFIEGFGNKGLVTNYVIPDTVD